MEAVHDLRPAIAESVRTRQMLLLVTAEVLLVCAAAYLGFSLYLPALIVGVAWVVLSFRFPGLWVFTVILFHFFILERTEGMSVWEILYAVYLFGYIGLWFGARLLRGERIVTSAPDVLLLAFLTICFLSAIPALLRQVSMLKWFREVIIFASYLLYFPAREAFAKKSNIVLAGVGLLVLAASIAVMNFAKYKAAAGSAIYAWQLLSGRQAVNEPLLMTWVLVGSALYLGARSKALRLVLLTLVSFFLLALVLTFSRGYWIGLVVGLLALLILLQRRDRLRALGATGVFGTIALVIVFGVFSELGTTILQIVAERLLSGKLGSAGDISLGSRYAETVTVLGLVGRNPFLGYGLGSLYVFLNPITGLSEKTWYVHNGYLFLWLKLGLPGLLLFLSTFALMMRQGFMVLRARRQTPEGYLIAGLLALATAMLAVSVTSPQFIARDSILILCLLWATFASLRDHVMATIPGSRG